MIDAQVLSRYIERFYGYGNYAGRFWSVGIEEAGAETVEDNAKRIAVWDQRGQRELEDLVEYHGALGLLDRFLGEQPKIQRTWGRLIRILLAATSEEQQEGASVGITPDAVRAYQRDLLGRADEDTCLIELLPLSSKSTGEWMWGGLGHGMPYISYLWNRKAYQDYCSPRRAEHIAARVREHKPEAVVFYSVTWTYRKWWERIAGVKLEKVSTELGDFYMGNNGHTIFAIVLHPADRRPKDAYFHQVGNVIASRRKTQGLP